MATLLEQTAVSILREAATSDFGIIVHVTAPNDDIPNPAVYAKQVLYRFKSQDPLFSNIQINFSPDNPNAELLLINKPRL